MKVIGENMVDYYLLEQLIAFSEEKSLSKAARRLDISQPALSKSMKKLESIIGVPLFERTSNSIKLNDTGRIAVKYAKKAIKDNQAIITNTRAFAQRQLNIRLGICSKPIQDWFTPLLISCYPYVQITYDCQDDSRLLEGINNDDYDLAIVHVRPNDSNLYTQYYFNEQLMLTLLKSDPLAKKKELHFRDLDGMSILANQGAEFWLDICKKNIPNLNLLIQENMTSLDTLVKESELPVFNSTRAIQDYPGPANKVTIPIVDSTAIVSYYLVCKKSEKQKFEKLFNQMKNDRA